MNRPRRRILVAAIIGAVVLGPALALSLYSLRALSVEQSRLAENERIARRNRLRRAAQITYDRCATLASELERAAGVGDAPARHAALRHLLATWEGLASGMLQVGPEGDAIVTESRGLLPVPEPPPTPEQVTAAFEPIWRIEWGRDGAAPDPAGAARAYVAIAESPATSRGLRARAWAAAARSAMQAEQPLTALRYCDAALGHGGALNAGASEGWFAYRDDGGFPLAWVLCMTKIEALSALIATEPAAALQVPHRVERGSTLKLLAELLAQNELEVPEAGIAVFEVGLKRAGGEQALAYYQGRRAARSALAATRHTVSRFLQSGADRARVIVSSSGPVELLVVAPLAGFGRRAGVAVPLHVEAVAATFTEAIQGLAPMDGEEYRLLAPDGSPLGTGAAPPGGEPTADVALPEALGPLRAAVWAPSGGGAIGAVGVLTRRAYIGLAIATLVAFAGGLLLFARVLTREVRLARLRADFVSSVTHELRTPLTSIQMFVETLLLGRVDGPEETRECLEVIGREAGRLRRMVDRVLSFARTERGDRVFEIRPQPVDRLVQGAVRLFSVADEGRRRAVDVDVPVGCPRVQADRDAIEEVLLNLLTNAAKYSPPTSPIALRVQPRNGHVTVTVADQGMGIPPDEIDRVFEGFYRSERARERGIPGTGIGLALSRRIARAHGGDLTVQSVPDAGATFTLALPQASALPTPNPEASA